MNSSLPTNDAVLANGELSEAIQRNGEARPSCFVCQGKIAGNQWFCRLPTNGNGESNPESLHILLCSPRCALRHFSTPRPRSNGFESDYEQYEPTVHFLMDGERPS